MRYDLEEQLGTGFAEWNEAELVNDQQILADQLLLQALQAPLVNRLYQFVDQCGGRREPDLETLLAGRQSQPQCDVGFAGPAQASDTLPVIRVLRRGSTIRSIPDRDKWWRSGGVPFTVELRI